MKYAVLPVILLGVLAMAPAVAADEPAPPTVAPDSQRLTFLLSGNGDGYFADVNCRQGVDDQSLWWAKHAGYHQSLSDLSQSSGLPRPIALHMGNSVFPGILGRYLATQGPDSAARLAELIAQVPIKVHGAGNREFTIPRTSFVDFAQGLSDQGIDVQAANLECPDFGGSEALCEVLQTGDDDKPFRTFERQGLTVAVATVLSPDLLDRLIREQRRGVRITNPLSVLPELIEAMNEAADMVVIQFQAPARSVMNGSRRLASAIDGIDLIIASQSLDGPRPANGNAPRGSLESVIHASGTGTPVVSADGGPTSLINLDVDLVYNRHGQRWQVRRVIPRRVDLTDNPVEMRTAALLRESIDDFCAHWGDAIGDDATLAAPMDLSDFQQFVLNVMRFSADQEIALLNRQAFRADAQFPLTGELTRADIYATLPFENQLVVADVPGNILAGAAASLGEFLVGAGISRDGDTLLVNGRPLNPDRVYRVAMNDFLAEGGDQHFKRDELQNARRFHPDWSDEPPTIDDMVINYVRGGRHLQRGPVTDVLSPTGNFPDLHRKPLWTITGSLNSSYNQVSVTNPDANGQPGYDQSRLNVQSTDQINFESRLTANADSRDHGFNNDLTVQYARARVHDDEAEQSIFETTKDQIRLRSRYRYQGWRARAEGRRYVPAPMVEGQLETEFLAPPDRDWHRFDLRGIAGVSFQLFEPLEIRFGANVNDEINRPDGQPTWGINASYSLARISPFALLGRPLRFESEMEYFYNDIGLQNIHEARTSNRIFFAIFEQFFFTTTFNAFWYRDDNIGAWGTNTELTVGINYSWEFARQSQ